MAEDLNEIAVRILAQSTGDKPKEKNPNAVALGKLGGAKGGPARAAALSTQRKRQIARKAARARWNKKD